MGISEMPDTFGLQEYYITEVVTEVIGDDVRVVCGVKRGEVIYWLYSVVLPAKRLAIISGACQKAADQALSGIEPKREQAEALH